MSVRKWRERRKRLTLGSPRWYFMSEHSGPVVGGGGAEEGVLEGGRAIPAEALRAVSKDT